VDLEVLTEQPTSKPLTRNEEKKRIDILAISKANKFALCIENKVWSGFHSEQLDTYYKYVDEQSALKGFTKFYVVLSPDENPVSEEESGKAGPAHYKEWLPISYGDIVEILKDIQEMKDINQKVKIIIADYIDCLANNQVVEDNDLNERLGEINNEHKVALDLIFKGQKDKQVKNITTVYAKPLNLIKKYRKDSPTLLKKNYLQILGEIKNEYDKYGISCIDAEKYYGSTPRLHITTHRMDSYFPPDKNTSLGSFKDGKKYAYLSMYENPPVVGFYFTPSGFYEDEEITSKMENFIEYGRKIKAVKTTRKAIREGKKGRQEVRVVESWPSESKGDPIDSYDKDKLKEALKHIFDDIKAWEDKMLPAVEENKPAT
jgi:hypothetical protein